MRKKDERLYSTDEKLRKDGWERSSQRLADRMGYRIGLLLRFSSVRGGLGRRMIDKSTRIKYHSMINILTNAREILEENVDGAFYRELSSSQLEELKSEYYQELKDYRGGQKARRVHNR